MMESSISSNDMDNIPDVVTDNEQHCRLPHKSPFVLRAGWEALVLGMLIKDNCDTL